MTKNNSTEKPSKKKKKLKEDKNENDKKKEKNNTRYKSNKLHSKKRGRKSVKKELEPEKHFEKSKNNENKNNLLLKNKNKKNVNIDDSETFEEELKIQDSKELDKTLFKKDVSNKDNYDYLKDRRQIIKKNNDECELMIIGKNEEGFDEGEKLEKAYNIREKEVFEKWKNDNYHNEDEFILSMTKSNSVSNGVIDNEFLNCLDKLIIQKIKEEGIENTNYSSEEEGFYLKQKEIEKKELIDAIINEDTIQFDDDNEIDNDIIDNSNEEVVSLDRFSNNSLSSSTASLSRKKKEEKQKKVNINLLKKIFWMKKLKNKIFMKKIL